MDATYQNNQIAQDWKAQSYSFTQRAMLSRVPINGAFELTARCNLSCKMCYVRLNPDQAGLKGCEKRAEEWISMAQQAYRAGTLFLLLTGGEPLLHPDFCEIYTALTQMGFLITIYTNATLIDEKIEQLFTRYPPTAVGVTLYGATAETYARVCGNAAGFQKTLDGLERLKRIGTNIEIRTTFIRDNRHEMEDIYRIASEYSGNYKINLDLFESFADVSTNVNSCRMDPVETLDFLDSYLKFLKHQHQHAKHAVINIKKTVRNPIQTEPKILSCVAGKSSYAITWDGRMVACSLFSQPCTQPFKEGFDTAWNRLPTLFEPIQKPDACLKCELDKIGACPNCPPKLYLETGSFTEVSPWLCEYAKERHRRAVERREAKKDHTL